MNERFVETSNLKKCYKNGEIDVEVIRGINISISEGEFCSIMGESGSGKSTLLHILGTLESPTDGDVIFAGKSLVSLSDKKKAEFRRLTMGFIFQSFYLIPGLTVFENIMMPNLLDRRQVDKAHLNSLLDQVGLMHRKKHSPTQLSGGEKQRTAIARALANNPRILLADEPTGNLDAKSSDQIIRLLKKINKEDGVTIIMVTHSKSIALQCGRIIYIKDGVIKC